jgi:hypothetical protein
MENGQLRMENNGDTIAYVLKIIITLKLFKIYVLRFKIYVLRFKIYDLRFNIYFYSKLIMINLKIDI